MEHQIDCGADTVATCHPPRYISALFQGQHINYRHESAQDAVWAHPVKDELLVDPRPLAPAIPKEPISVAIDRPLPEVQWGVKESPVTNFAWIRCLRVQSVSWLLVASGYDQLLIVQAGDILFLPLVICRWLLANRPTDWQQWTAVPDSLYNSTSNDAGTGLDYLPAVTTGAWGVDAISPYFTLDGDMGSGERADLYIDPVGVYYVVQ